MHESQLGGHTHPASSVRTKECFNASWGWAHTPQVIRLLTSSVSEWCYFCSSRAAQKCVWSRSMCCWSGAASPDQLLSVPLGSTWIHHMTELADTHKEDSLLMQKHTLPLFLVTFKDSWRCQQLYYSDSKWWNLIMHLSWDTKQLLCCLIPLPSIHPQYNHSTCILIEQDWCHGMNPTDPYFQWSPAGWGGYKRRLAPTKAPLLLQWCHQWLDLFPLAPINTLPFKFNQRGIW